MKDKKSNVANFLSDSTEYELLNDPQATKHLGLASGTLSVWRSKGRYNIPFIKIGANVRYRKSDLDAWLESHTHTATT